MNDPSTPHRPAYVRHQIAAWSVFTPGGSRLDTYAFERDAVNRANELFTYVVVVGPRGDATRKQP